MNNLIIFLFLSRTKKQSDNQKIYFHFCLNELLSIFILFIWTYIGILYKHEFCDHYSNVTTLYDENALKLQLLLSF